MKENHMMLGITKFCAAILLLLSMMNAFAKTDNSWEAQMTAQIERQIQWAEASEARRDDIPGPRNFERREVREPREVREVREPREVRQVEEPRGARQIGNESNFASDNSNKRGGKMTPEERRELRRQINEAGRNIYNSK